MLLLLLMLFFPHNINTIFISHCILQDSRQFLNSLGFTHFTSKKFIIVEDLENRFKLFTNHFSTLKYESFPIE